MNRNQGDDKILRVVAWQARRPQLAESPAQHKAGGKAIFLNAPTTMFSLELIRGDCLRAQMHVCFDIAPRLLLVIPDIADITHMTLLDQPQKLQS